MLIQRGASAVISLPAQRLLAEMFVPSVVRTNAKEAKNAAARLSHLSMSWEAACQYPREKREGCWRTVSGSQSVAPYRT